MADPRLLFTLPQAIPLPADGRAQRWCYLGADPLQKRTVQRRLAQLQETPYGDSLQALLEENRASFSDWLNDVGALQKNRIHWLASAAASKIPWQSDLFLLIGYALLVEKWLTEEPAVPLCLVVVEDPWLFQTLRRRLEDDPRAAFHTGGNRALQIFKLIRALQGGLRRARFLVSALLQKAAQGVIHPPDPPLTAAGDDGKLRASKEVWLFSWVEDHAFRTPHQFTDAYLGRLDPLLESDGYSVKRLLSPRIALRYFFRLRKIQPGFIPVLRSVRWRDILRCAFLNFSLNGWDALPPFKQWDCSLLLRREVCLERSRGEFQWLCLWHRTLGHLARSQGARLNAIVYPFENQPFEKLLIESWRQHAPHVQLLAYQHSTYSPLYLSYFLTSQEKERAPLPDWIIANGAYFQGRLTQEGWPASRIVNGGSFRYEYLLDRSSSKKTSSQSGRKILVVLPTAKHYAQTLLHDLLDLYPAGGEKGDPEFILKPHPDMPLPKLLAGRALPPGFAPAQRPLRELLAEARLCLYMPQTTASLEAACAGIPLLKYTSDLPDMDFIDPSWGVRIIPCAKERLKTTIQKLLEEQAPPAPWTVEAVEKIFSPVDPAVWLGLIRPEKLHMITP